MWYRADYENDEFEMIIADSDDNALAEAFALEEKLGTLFNVFLVDDDFEEIKTIF